MLTGKVHFVLEIEHVQSGNLDRDDPISDWDVQSDVQKFEINIGFHNFVIDWLIFGLFFGLFKSYV